LDDIAVRIAEIDRPAEAVVDRPAHLSAFIPALLQHPLEGRGSTPRAMCRSRSFCCLNSNSRPGTSKKARQEPSFIAKKELRPWPSATLKALTSFRPRKSS